MAESRSKADLLSALREGQREVVDKLRAAPAERFEEGRYESGWNGRQILAHAAAMEWTYPRLIDLAAGTAAKTEQSSSSGEATPKKSSSFSGGVNDYNERQVAKRAGASIEELLDELNTNRQALIDAVEDADEDLFAREIRSAGGIQGSLANVIYALAIGHTGAHVNDIIGSE